MINPPVEDKDTEAFAQEFFRDGPADPVVTAGDKDIFHRTQHSFLMFGRVRRTLNAWFFFLNNRNNTDSFRRKSFRRRSRRRSSPRFSEFV